MFSATAFGLDTVGGYGVDNVSVTNVEQLVCDAAVNPDTGCNVVYSSASDLFETCGDGDLNIEPGEQWQVDIDLTKLGAGDAVNTMADLAVNAGSTAGAIVTGNPQNYGTIPGNGGVGTGSYGFTVDGGAGCLTDLTFDVTNVSDNSTLYPDELAVLDLPIGSVAASETGNQQFNPAGVTAGTATSPLTPAFSLPTPVTSASIRYDFNYDNVLSEFATQDTSPLEPQNGALQSTLSPAFAAGSGNVTSATVDWTSLSYIGSGNLNNCTRVFLVTPDATEIDLKAQGDPAANPYDVLSIYQGVNGGPGQYSIGVWERQGGGCNGTASLGGGTMAVDGAAPGDFTNNAQVVLWDGSSSTILKGFGAPDANPYDVTAIYNAAGGGSYEIRVEESGGGGSAEVSSAAMTLTTGSCDGFCSPGSPTPPPVGDGVNGSLMTLDKGVGPDDVVVTIDNATCSADHAVVLYGTLGNFTGYQGAVTTGCDLGAGPSGTVTQAGDMLWFNVIWVNADDDGGYPGDATAGARSWSAAGLCGVVSDDTSDPVCD
jgi:hypothetical protein